MAAEKRLTVAAVQFAAGTDIKANTTRIAELVEDAAGRGAELVVLPEAAMYDWTAKGEDLAVAARDAQQTFLASLTSLTRRLGITVVAGTYAESPNAERPYNRLVIVSPEGVGGHYDKLHLYDAFSYQESANVSPGIITEDGSELVSFLVGSFTVGLLNCYDIRFPEMARALVDRGADLLVVSSAWASGPLKELHWETLLRARAIENTCYVVAACQSPPLSTGLSTVISPLGVSIATCAEDEGVILADLLPSHITHARDVVPSLANRRLNWQAAAVPLASDCSIEGIR